MARFCSMIINFISYLYFIYFLKLTEKGKLKGKLFYFSIFRGITPYAVQIFSKHLNFGRVIKSSMQNRFDSKKGLIVN